MYLALNILHHIIENYAEGFFLGGRVLWKMSKGKKNVSKEMHAQNWQWQQRNIPTVFLLALYGTVEEVVVCSSRKLSRSSSPKARREENAAAAGKADGCRRSTWMQMQDVSLCSTCLCRLSCCRWHRCVFYSAADVLQSHCKSGWADCVRRWRWEESPKGLDMPDKCCLYRR